MMMSSATSTTTIFLALLCFFSATIAAHARVDFCGSPARLPVAGRYDCIVEDDPLTTCGVLFFSLAAFSSSNSYTNRMIQKHRATCCDASKQPVCLDNPAVVAVEEKDEEDKGDEKYCRVCGNNDLVPDEFPGLPDVTISARYVGDLKSCRELYYMGINKEIATFMCGPLQDYAYEVCGCGEFHPAMGDFIEVPDDKVPESLKEEAAAADEAEAASVASAEESDDDSCSSLTTKDSCGDNKSCKWEKKDKICEDKKRRLLRGSTEEEQQ